MLALSLLLVLGVLAWLLLSLAVPSATLPFGHEQLIHARVPWLVLGVLWLGGGFGVAALWRGRGQGGKRRWLRTPLVALSLLLVALLSAYFLRQSFEPEERGLRVATGDAFPSYALLDQDSQPHSIMSGAPRPPALYVFYRGDW